MVSRVRLTDDSDSVSFYTVPFCRPCKLSRTFCYCQWSLKMLCFPVQDCIVKWTFLCVKLGRILCLFLRVDIITRSIAGLLSVWGLTVDVGRHIFHVVFYSTCCIVCDWPCVFLCTHMFVCVLIKGQRTERRLGTVLSLPSLEGWRHGSGEIDVSQCSVCLHLV